MIVKDSFKKNDANNVTEIANSNKKINQRLIHSQDFYVPSTWKHPIPNTNARIVHDFDLANNTTGNGNGDPQHAGSGDANKRLKYAFNDTRNININCNDNENNVSVKKLTEDDSSSSNEENGNGKERSSRNTLFPSWATATTVIVAASVAVVVFAVVRGSKRK